MSLRNGKFLPLILLLILLQACGGVSKDEDDEDGDNGDNGGTTPPPVTGPLPPLGETVQVENGILQGVRIPEQDLIHYQGIPYAAAPVGDFRWRAPQPAQHWEGIRDAAEAGAACIQGNTNDIATVQSEDCLFLNIAAPEAETETGRPVMVWFHGGGDDNGSSTEIVYDIPGLAEATGHVVVSVNSRLGFLGFLALPGLRLESADDSTGNYAHLDQVQALQWIQDNIHAFNGNPNNVTLFGESAGGNGVCRHLSSPLSAGLFHRAIMQSGSCGPNILHSLDQRYVQGNRYLEIWGCATAEAPLDCLRQQDALDMRQALKNDGKADNLLGGDLQDQEIYRPVAAIDGHAFTATPYEALTDSPANIDVMIGVTRNEYTLLLQNENSDIPVDLASYQDAVKANIPGITDPEVLKITTNLYLVDLYDSYGDAFADVMSDAVFGCPSVATADVLVRGGHSVRFYQFDREVNEDALLTVVQPLHPNAPALGVPHSADLFYLWDLAIMQKEPPPAVLTVRAVQQYWGRFAGNGVPSADEQPDWPLYTIDGGEYLNIGVPLTAETGFRLEKCDFFNDQ